MGSLGLGFRVTQLMLRCRLCRNVVGRASKTGERVLKLFVLGV